MRFDAFVVAIVPFCNVLCESYVPSFLQCCLLLVTEKKVHGDNGALARTAEDMGNLGGIHELAGSYKHLARPSHLFGAILGQFKLGLPGAPSVDCPLSLAYLISLVWVHNDQKGSYRGEQCKLWGSLRSHQTFWPIVLYGNIKVETGSREYFGLSG